MGQPDRPLPHGLQKGPRGKRPRLVKNSLQEILLCSHQALFPRVVGDLVALLEGNTIHTKLFEDGGTLGAIPAVGQQNTANIPKDSADLRHACLSVGR